MKSILGGAAIGGAIGLGIDGASNKKGDHNYLGSFALGAAIGAAGVGVLGSKSAVAAKPVKSSHPQQAKPQAAPASPVAPQAVQTPQPVPSAAPVPVPAPVASQAPAQPLKATATQTPVVPAQPTQPKGPSAFAVARDKLKTTGATIRQGLSSGGKTVWQKLNTNVPMPNMTLPQIPKIDLEPAKQWAKGKASAIQNSVGNSVSKISNSISSAGDSLKATGSSLNQKAGAVLESIKGMTATARQYAARPISLKIPSVNVNLPKMPKGVSSGISTALENGKRALPNYLRKGVFAIAVMAGSFASHGPSFNPVKPMIEHAQQTMSTSKFGSQAISEFMSDAKQIGSQVMDDITEAIPRALEHPKSTMKEAFGASAIKPATESSVVGNSMGLTNIPMDIMTNIEKEHILSSGIDKNLSYGNALIKSNKTNDLLPEAKAMAELFIARAKKAGLDLRVSETFRNFNQQDAYFAQGRTAPGGIITNAMSGEGLHGYGLALDVYPVVNGSALTTITKDNKKYWDKMGEIGESVGFEWGGRWKEFRDMPHFELNKNISIQDMRRARLGVLDNEQQDMWISKKLKDLDRRSNKESRIEEKTKINEHISNVKKLRKFSF